MGSANLADVQRADFPFCWTSSLSGASGHYQHVERPHGPDFRAFVIPALMAAAGLGRDHAGPAPGIER